MKTLNLVSLEKSDIKYKKIQYPDNQQNITIESNNLDVVISTHVIPMKGVLGVQEVIHKTPIQIKSRLNNFQDLEIIICTVKSLRNLGVKEIHLYTPYFLGSRSDRQFEEGSCNYLKDIICPIINSLEFESVTVLDPHSSVLEALITNFKSINNKSLVQFALNDMGISKRDNQILISPDGGSLKKIYKLAEQIGYKEDIITCSKDRDKDGKLIKTEVPVKLEQLEKDLIIIDDIGDGCGTFINIAKILDKMSQDNLITNKINSIGKRYLIITHGLFTNGFEELSKYFDGIYCTNSYRDIPQYKEYNEISIGSKILKQLNVF